MFQVINVQFRGGTRDATYSLLFAFFIDEISRSLDFLNGTLFFIWQIQYSQSTIFIKRA
jgi:hypothetical protein